MSKINEEQAKMMYGLHDNPPVNPDGRITEEKIANLFGVSTSTVSLKINKVRDKQRIQMLEGQLEERNGQVAELEEKVAVLERELYGRKLFRRIA